MNNRMLSKFQKIDQQNYLNNHRQYNNQFNIDQTEITNKIMIKHNKYKIKKQTMNRTDIN